ncbi:CLUMA_CG017611, isoform A [Clunio marinus]|uniref:CLUMA_CG017611, isoform A n=1 Tax=Clunio marinus TaxID=568069 RepID=A0A1J1IXU5_9DIPT|nr:CLUMA_CG017611, isoform A [Clunio marinus]
MSKNIVDKFLFQIKEKSFKVQVSMNLTSFLILFFSSFLKVLCESEETIFIDDQTPEILSNIDASCKSLLYLHTNKIDAETLIKADNQGVRMGVASKHCDNARRNISVDFDPKNPSEVEMHTKCLTSEPCGPNTSVEPILTLMNLPKRYFPIHKCMNIQINYVEKIPTIGPHRPLWARYGEYSYVPVQRWLHNVEHGAIIGIYHPCADDDQVSQLKTLIKRCLFRHVITPFLNLTCDRPIALIGWAASLEMSYFDYDLAKNFIKCFAKTGPERNFRDGQYHHLLIENAKHVTNVIDHEVCPDIPAWEISKET